MTGETIRLSLVVTTLGRLDALRTLLGSLDGQLRDGDDLVLVAQGEVDRVRALAAEFAGVLPITVAESGRGATRGRNAGVESLPGGDTVLAFPNDTSVYPPGTLEAVRREIAAAGAGFLYGRMASHDERGPKSALPDPGTPLDRVNLWTVIEMGLLIRRRLFDEIGGFSLDFGPGQPTPWQAGEAADLLLRALAAHPELAREFRWLPRRIHVGGISTGFGLDGAGRRRKLRSYGRGTAQVLARHPYPWWWRSAYVGAGLVFGLRNPRPIRAADGWWMFLGRLEGSLGTTFGSSDLVSTTR